MCKNVLTLVNVAAILTSMKRIRHEIVSGRIHPVVKVKLLKLSDRLQRTTSDLVHQAVARFVGEHEHLLNGK